MGQEVVVRGARSLSLVLAALSADGTPCQVVMVDGALVFPTAPPPTVWTEVRLRLLGGMVTLRRRGDDVVLLVFGNATSETAAARDRIAAALSGGAPTAA